MNDINAIIQEKWSMDPIVEPALKNDEVHKPVVLFFDTFSRTGGSLSYLVNIADALSRETCRFRYIFYLNPAVKKMVGQLEKVAEVRYADDSFLRGGLMGFFRRRNALRHIVRDVSPDILLSLNQMEIRFKNIFSAVFLQNALYFIPFARARRMGYSMRHFIICRFLRRCTISSMKNSDAIITSTSAFKRLIEEDVGSKNPPWIVAPFGNNPVVIDSASRDYSRCRKLLCLQYNFYKGIEIAVKALDLLVRGGYDVELTITDTLQGSGSREARGIWSLVEELGLTDRIHCVGKVAHDRIHEVFRDHDMFVFPSYIESFGFGQLEAMGNGMPCVVSDIGVNRELCADVARYFPAGDFEFLADEIKVLLGNSNLRKSLGEEGRIQSSRYTWERHVDELEHGLQSLLIKNKQARVNCR